MPLKIEDLEANNIFISDRNLEPRDIPKHILLLRQVFLDNHGTLQNRYNLDDDDDPWTIRCQEAWSRRRTSDQDAIKDVIENAELVAKKAKKLVANGSVENLWLKFFRVTFFEPLVKRFEPLDRGPRYLSRQNYFFDAVTYVEDRYWNLFDGRNGFQSQDREGLSKPVPDGAFYFPVREDGFRTNESQLEDALQWKHSAHERLAKQLSGNLAHDTLVDLEKFGLQFCPFGPSNSKSLAKDSMVCFPWLVIEHKPGDMIKTRPKEKECYCQAANASAAALMLLQRAAVFAEAKDQNQHVPPVVAVTTVGNIVRVWMTYYNQKEERDRHDMIPIWHGDMTKVLDIWKFEAILENVHIWATRTLRPLLSTYVMQWKNRFIDKKAIHGASMSQVLETLKHNHVTERINLTQAIDYAAQRGFEMGRHHALTFDHQLILDSTRYACIEENNKFLTRLERTLDVKFQRDQELRDGLSMRKLENVLDETIRGSQNSVMSQLDMMNKKIDMLHLSRVSSGSNCANDVSNTMTGSGKDDEEQDLPLPISIVTQGSSHKLFIREAIREYVTAISSMDQAIPTESVEGTTFTTDAPAQSLSSPPAVRNVQTETFNIMNSSSASISMQTLPPTEEKSSENADRKTENQVAPLPNGTKWILTS